MAVDKERTLWGGERSGGGSSKKLLDRDAGHDRSCVKSLKLISSAKIFFCQIRSWS